LDAYESAASDIDRAAIELELMRQVSIFWRTRLLRSVKLGVEDEVENAVSYFERSFLPELPRLYAHWLGVLGRPERLNSFLRVGSWAGGDRDGTPYVAGEVMQAAMARQARAVLQVYLERTHALGAELSLSAGLAPVTPPLQALADAGADPSPHRADEPYRRAI